MKITLYDQRRRLHMRRRFREEWSLPAVLDLFNRNGGIRVVKNVKKLQTEPKPQIKLQTKPQAETKPSK